MPNGISGGLGIGGGGNGGGFNLGGLVDPLLQGLGNVLTGTVTAALGNLAGAALSKALLGLGISPDIVNAITTGTLSLPGPSSLGGGPALQPGLDFAAYLQSQLGQPFDVSGIGGGVLTAGPYLGQAGRVAGELLRSKKISLDALLTGSGKQVSVLASILQRRFPLGVIS